MTASALPIFIPLSFFLAALIIVLPTRKPGAFPFAAAVLGAGAAFGFSLTGLLQLAPLEPGAALVHRLGGWDPPAGIILVMDHLSAFVATVITGVGLLVLLHSRRILPSELGGKERPFYSTAALLMGGLTGMVLTGDLFNLYVFLEISSIASYALISQGSRAAPIAAFRYLILGTVGASFYLLGLGFVFIATGSLNMTDVAAILAASAPLENPAILTGLILIVAGLGVKMALFPLHGWLPDAYSLASSTASSLIAPIGTKVAVYALLRIGVGVFGLDLWTRHLPIGQAVAWLGGLGIMYGSIMAIAQTDLKRMLAYSSVGQVGYLAVGIGLATPLAITGALLHLLNHAIMKACLFLVAANLQARFGVSTISLFTPAMRRDMPWVAAGFTVAVLSMIGLPPTAGFFSKWYLVLGCLEADAWVLLACILISTLLNAVYFFRVIERLYLREAEPPEPGVLGRISPSLALPVVVLAGLLLLLGLGNQYVVDAAVKKTIPVLLRESPVAEDSQP